MWALGEYMIESLGKEPSGIEHSMAVRQRKSTADLRELDFVGKRLILFVEESITVYPQIPCYAY